MKIRFLFSTVLQLSLLIFSEVPPRMPGAVITLTLIVSEGRCLTAFGPHNINVNPSITKTALSHIPLRITTPAVRKFLSPLPPIEAFYSKQLISRYESDPPLDVSGLNPTPWQSDSRHNKTESDLLRDGNIKRTLTESALWITKFW